MKLPKVYEPKQYEPDTYTLWESSGAFEPSGKGEPYSIVMPPPNANANIHLGTAITLDLEDIITRYQRMRGKDVLYLPGADHAGIETQFVYEKHLAKKGKSRLDFTRDELYQQVWDFVEENKKGYETQFRMLGVSPDWDRYVYTLDEKIVKRAYKTFKQMWDDKLIYRGERLVNYCTFHDTGFADIEVTYKEEKGHLWHISYPVPDGSDELVVATTRPETMFGDVAVAVHPDDKRYKHLIGKKLMLPIAEREIPVIADDFVDSEFGTGAVKITPAHDQNDFEAGERNNLEQITVINFDGTMNENAPEKYRGMSVDQARKEVVKDLKKHDYLVLEEDYIHNVGHCYKCDTVIQPLLKEQWFINMQPLAKRAIKVLEDERIKFYPDTKRQQLVNYLKGLRDWNISRQNAWGIPIPAFQNTEDPADWIFDERVHEEQIEINGRTYKRDPDVFDTWFSSGSWPYATLDFPDGDDFKKYYPLSVMETGGEILYPWVARMIMLGLYVTDEIPFKEVYIHGYILAEDGSKMSKSVGNVVDPLPLIAEFGSDAVRMGLIAGRVAGVNRRYDNRKIESARNFCNKLWNITRYIEGQVGDRGAKSGEKNPQSSILNPQSSADHWIMRELDASANEVASLLEEYRFAEAVEAVYHTVWDKLADWYLEASKTAPNPSVMVWALETCLKIAHPFAPFVTETIWQTLKWDDSLLITSRWPTRVKYDEKQAEQFEQLQNIIKESRGVLAEIGTTDIELRTTGSQLVLDNSETIRKMTRVGFVENVKEGSGLRLTSTSEPVWLGLSEEQIKTYKASLEKKLAELMTKREHIERRLSNESYVKNAPELLVQESREELEQLATQTDHLKTQLKHL